MDVEMEVDATAHNDVEMGASHLETPQSSHNNNHMETRGRVSTHHDDLET